MRVKIGVSNRHVHLTQEVYEKLFDKLELSKRNDLNQPLEFASNEIVTIKTSKNIIENVRILGPFRNYNQVEISKTDAYKLGINPPVRKSGDLENSESLIVIGPKGEIELKNSTIIAQRHLHISKAAALENNLSDNDLLKLIVINGKGGVMLCNVKISDEAFLELHLDTDDANAFLLKSGDDVEVEKIEGLSNKND